MIVDCTDCLVRDIACADCVVTVLLGTPGRRSDVLFTGPLKRPRINLEQDELGAMDILADSGLVPRLRLVLSADEVESTDSKVPAVTADSPGDQRAG